jgi:uncharacterized membrane protein YuzA (DUF378 family)
MTETVGPPESKAMPVEIRRAVNVLWLSLLLSVTAATIADWRQVYRLDSTFSVVVQVFENSFFALIIWKVGQGRSWARITYLLVFAGGCLLIPLLAVFSETYRAAAFGSRFSVVVLVLQTAIQLYATVLLCTSKGRTWFLRRQ